MFRRVVKSGLLIVVLSLVLVVPSSAWAAPGDICMETHNCILVNYKEDCSNSINAPPQWTVSMTILRYDGVQYVYYMAHRGVNGQYRTYQKWTGQYPAGNYSVRIQTPNGWDTWWFPLTVTNNGNWLGSFTQVRTC